MVRQRSKPSATGALAARGLFAFSHAAWNELVGVEFTDEIQKLTRTLGPLRRYERNMLFILSVRFGGTVRMVREIPGRNGPGYRPLAGLHRSPAPKRSGRPCPPPPPWRGCTSPVR